MTSTRPPSNAAGRGAREIGRGQKVVAALRDQVEIKPHEINVYCGSIVLKKSLVIIDES
jgi:hypothetical protein